MMAICTCSQLVYHAHIAIGWRQLYQNIYAGVEEAIESSQLSKCQTECQTEITLLALIVSASCKHTLCVCSYVYSFQICSLPFCVYFNILCSQLHIQLQEARTVTIYRQLYSCSLATALASQLATQLTSQLYV